MDDEDFDFDWPWGWLILFAILLGLVAWEMLK
jgi:hypothetical protein